MRNTSIGLVGCVTVVLVGICYASSQDEEATVDAEKPSGEIRLSEDLAGKIQLGLGRRDREDEAAADEMSRRHITAAEDYHEWTRIFLNVASAEELESEVQRLEKRIADMPLEQKLAGLQMLLKQDSHLSEKFLSDIRRSLVDSDVPE